MVNIVNVGGFIGNLIYLWAVDKFGSKRAAQFLAIPIVVSSIKPIFFKQTQNKQ